VGDKKILGLLFELSITEFQHYFTQIHNKLGFIRPLEIKAMGERKKNLRMTKHSKKNIRAREKFHPPITFQMVDP